MMQRLQQDGDEAPNNENELWWSVCNGQCIAKNVQLLCVSFFSLSSPSLSLFISREKECWCESSCLYRKHCIVVVVMLAGVHLFFHRYGMRIFVSISFSQVNEHKINIGVSCVHAPNAYLLTFTRAAFQQSIHLQLNRNTTNEKQHTQKKTWRNNAHTAYKRTNSNSNNRFGNKEFCIYSMMSVCV